ncbi:hypothetical protein [Orrella marina]|uniref:Uncharacterized protein n=1 Tax=Orrella marina TaxID=2163011 RepID=A0A2R4XIK0_9BURK|nr:hypothetical protein [Orrella marina]AWB33630.1 hypothetical protein DBV39_07810 [Orrella marina]
MGELLNATHAEHVLIALTIQGLFVLGFSVFRLADGVWYGAVFVLAVFLGREHAQREYKLGEPSRLAGYEAFDFWRWSPDALLDLCLPVVAVFVVAMSVSRFRR